MPEGLGFGQILVSYVVYLLPVLILMVVFRGIVLWYLGIDKVSKDIAEIKEYISVEKRGVR